MARLTFSAPAGTLGRQLGGPFGQYLVGTWFPDFQVHYSAALETLIECTVDILLQVHVSVAFGARFEVKHFGDSRFLYGAR